MNHAPQTVSASRRRRLATPVEAAAYVRQSRDSIRRRISDGTITGYRCGPRTILVDLDEIDEKLLRRIPTAGAVDV